MLLALLLLGASAYAGWTELDDRGECRIRLPDNHRFEKVHRAFRRGEAPEAAESSARRVALGRMVERVCTDRTPDACARLRAAIGVDVAVNLDARQVCAVALVRTDLTSSSPPEPPTGAQAGPPQASPAPEPPARRPRRTAEPALALTADRSREAAMSRPRETLGQLEQRLSQAPGERCALRSGYATRPVPAGATTIGCTPSVDDHCAYYQRSRTREIEVTTPLLVGEVEVTRGLWARVLRQTPPGQATCGDTCPVAGATWLESVRLANALSEYDGLRPCYRIRKGTVRWRRGPTCEGYRLPTPSEWEHAARAGVDTRFAGSNDPDEVAWWAGNSFGQPHPVGLLKPNRFGLYDMSGNVGEWVWGNRRFTTSTDADGARPRRVRTNGGPTGEAFVESHEARGGAYPHAAPHVHHIFYAQPTTRTRSVGVRLVRYAEGCD